MRCTVHNIMVFLLALRPSKAFIVRASSSPATAAARSLSASTVVADETTNDSTTAYTQLTDALQQITHLKHSQAVLNYDQLVFMPTKASADRGAQLGALASIIHEQSTTVLEPLLVAAEQQMKEQQRQSSSNSDADQTLVVQLTREEFDRTNRIPAALEKKRALLSSTAYADWNQARTADDFSLFRDTLADCFATAQETASAVRGDGDDESSSSLYNVMLDEFERGMATSRIDSIFDEIETALVPLLSRVLASPNTPSTDCLEGTFDVDKQQELSRTIVTALGFDQNSGRIDVSVHPFTSSLSTSDVRITSRFGPNEWYQGLAGSIHESGHAMYEQNLPAGTNLPIDTFLSMGCHESQSLFWERHVSLSKPFWTWAAPLLQDMLDVNVSANDLYRAVNTVRPGCIRVTADELTYPLHVILRYKIERDVVEGRLAVSDIPQVWNDSMKEMLDVTVPSDAQGCLQDVHWSAMAIGYFPTYLLGSATAAQLAYYCKQDIVDFDERVAQGDFAPIKAWLTDKVHRHGRRYASLDALLEDQLGEKLNPKYFIEYLKEKYSELYEC